MADLIRAVTDREKYAPVPPPLIDQSQEIAWFPRSSTWSYNDYDGGLGPHRQSIDIDPRSQTYDRSVNSHAIWLLPDLINKNDPAIETWILTYLLKLIRLDLGVFYLDKIEQDGATYPNEIQEAIRAVIDQTSQVNQISDQLGLYLPESTRQSLDFFFMSLYWLRKFRPERLALTQILKEATATDLYLAPSNLYEHHPGRKLLSYYDDQELVMRFGQIEYSTKKEQLDTIVAFGLSRFGYLQVEQWERPIRVRYYPDGTELSLDQLLSLKYIPRLVLLRLAIQIHASWPWLHDPEVWEPLLSLIDHDSHLFYNEYLLSKRQDYESVPERITTNLFEMEFAPVECLVCGVVRSDDDFALCGHPICLVCQAMIKSAQCPFCTEHFTAEAIRDDFIELIRDGPAPNRNLKERVHEIITKSRDRLFQFDWANLQIRLFGLKSL